MFVNQKISIMLINITNLALLFRYCVVNSVNLFVKFWMMIKMKMNVKMVHQSDWMDRNNWLKYKKMIKYKA